MTTATGALVRKHFRLDAAKLKRTKELFGVSTETEAVDRALDFVIEEYERNRVVEEMHCEFRASGIVIRDVLGSLG